jgi:hypothetical protein
MESNSERNRIQVSQSTADLLIADGKRHWLTPRKDLVNAKGKGLMQTYWCEPKSRGGSSSAKESSADSQGDTNYDTADCENETNTIREDDEASSRRAGSISNPEPTQGANGIDPRHSNVGSNLINDVESDRGTAHGIEEAIFGVACGMPQHKLPCEKCYEESLEVEHDRVLQ